jgi:glycosyltransferase involved in cell wall biosynthesis
MSDTEHGWQAECSCQLYTTDLVFRFPSMSEIDLSLIIPCYRDAGHLRKNVGTIVECLRDTRLSWEIVMVNDASPENDGEAALQAVADWPGYDLRILTHEKNTGRGRAVMDGLAVARGRFGGFVDIDLEVGAHYIPYMVSTLQAGADVACGLRIYKTCLGLIHRAILSHGYSYLVRNLLGADLKDTEAGYKFFNMDTVRPVLAHCTDPGWFWDTEIMVRSKLAGLDVRFSPVLFLRNPEKASTVKIVSDSIEQFKRLWKFRQELTTKPAPVEGALAQRAVSTH